MSLIKKLESVLGNEEEKTYSYECGDCGARFESTFVNPNRTDCPDCGSSRIHTVT